LCWFLVSRWLAIDLASLTAGTLERRAIAAVVLNRVDLVVDVYDLLAGSPSFRRH